MTNFELWKLYMSTDPAPELFADIGFYYMISAALQRRVWYGALDRPIFPNQYVLLVADAGIGKGGVTGPVESMLTFFPRSAGADPNFDINLNAFDASGRDEETDLLYPNGPNASSYQALASELAKKVRTFTCAGFNHPIAHSSMHIVLDEFTSMFKESAQDTVDFFLTCWMGKNYKHSTIGRGKDYIKNPCLSMIAGTTPDRIRELRKISIVGSGLSRRMLFVYTDEERFRAWNRPPSTEEQKAARIKLLKWIRILSTAVGEVKYSAAANKAIDDWFFGPNCTINKSQHEIVTTYERSKAPHLHKMIMAVHFSELKYWTPGTPPGEVTAEEVELAIKLLQRTEVDRHRVLEFSGRSDLSPVAGKIVNALRYAAQRGLTREEILAETFNEFDTQDQLDTMLNTLMTVGKIYGKTALRGSYKYYATRTN